jgi:large repetitive protein
VAGRAAAVTGETSLSGLAPDADLQVAAVGDRGVVFDRSTGVLYLPDGTPVTIPDGTGGMLQQSGPDDSAVSVATAGALVRQPLGGGDPQVVATVDEGTPAAPVSLAGCVYAVWSGSGAYARSCAGDVQPTVKRIDVPASSSLVLRTNRRVVVVNDVTAGSVWIVDQDVEKVDNWDDVTPPAKDDSDQDQSEEQKPQYELPERSAQNNPPTAVDDEYGVRAGRTALLPVTDNDIDPDGDLLSATAQSTPPGGYTIASVLGGADLQVAVPANASGSTSFTYTVDDGRGGTDDANVTLSVHDASVNGAPEQRRVNTVQVEAGASLSYGALDGWVDPDGDDFYLKQASVEGGDTVTYRSNGVVEFTAASGQPGVKEVRLVVSDGREDAEGVLRVNVRPAGSLDPVANSDRVTATAGVPVTVSPLSNDLSPSGQPLRLSKLDSLPGVRITPNYSDGTFEFASDTPGTFYVQYLVTDGPRSGIGLVRIDVLAGGAGGAAPVAVRDLALLPVGRDVLVDVLANDSDPAGGILVVQSARAAGNSGVSVEVLTHSVLRITDLAGLSAPVTVSYTVSNGTQSATGEVLVLPVALPEKLRPPVAVADTATVRVGDVVSVPVLNNDYHPDNDRITLSPTLVETDAADPSSIFVAGDVVRFQAGQTPGTVHATYQIEDSQQNRTAGYLTIQVLPADAGTNSPPRPKTVTARAVAGTTERIAIPLEGIDPDGDSVELVGLSSTPTKGRVTVGATWLTYEAYPNASGRDTFTYVVRDHLGATAESTVTVGVAPPGFENQAPYAAKDTVSVRPGRAVAVPVTANDSDPDGDAITLSTDLVVPDGIRASVAGGRVLVTAPGSPGDYTITYVIADDYGATAQGVLLVHVDPDAPLVAPIARDDRASVLDIGDDLTVAVPVLDNDEDPDGTIAGLTVAVDDPDAVVAADGTVTLPVTDAAQIVRYSITDGDGLVGRAFVFVPGASTLVPTLTTTEPIVVKSGETATIALADHVRVRGGHQARISTADSVRTGHADGSSPIVDEHTLSYTSAPGYFGPDTLGVRVTDGTGPDDPEGLSAYVTIPIRVLPAENQSPTLRNASVTVAPGEDAVQLNLAKLAYDPDEGDQAKLVFALSGAVPAGFQASVSGSTLTVSANADAPSGQTATLGIQASDGVSAPGQGSVSIATVTSQRPFPVANDDVIAQADQGKTQTVDVLANDYNPFADRGPLKIVSARVDSGRGNAVVQGDRVAVTPAADFTGTMIVTYRVQDATGAADRQVDGRILLTVQGKPDVPGTPTVTSIQDRTVVLSWTAPANNGAAITEYRVSSPQGFSRSCPATTCTLDGLTNDVDYTFTVVAVNSVGQSDPSPSSAPARPDARPDTPSAPTTVFGDKSITVNWATPNSNGSPVLSYNLEISPAPAAGSIQKTGVTGNSLTWSGLENGVAYQVRVQAVNRAPDPSAWSSYSATVVPAGVPDAPGTPKAQYAPSVGAQAQITVAWAPPTNTNGDAIADYTVTATGGDGSAKAQTVSGTSATFTVGTSTAEYAFAVTARNKAGSSTSSPVSNQVRATNAPGAPTGVTVADTGTASQLRVTITAGDWNGNSPNEVEWKSSAGDVQIESQSGSTVVGLVNGAANGEMQSVTVWGVSTVSGKDGGKTTSSNQASPYGPVNQPTASATQNGQSVTLGWAPPASNGRPIDRLEISVDGGGWENVGPNAGNRSVGNGYSQTHSIRVKAFDTAGQVSAGDGPYADARTADPPPPSQWTVKVDNADSCLEDADNTPVHYGGGKCSSSWAKANSDQTATCWTTWSHKNTNGDYRWFRLTSGQYLSVYTTVGEVIPGGMPTC